MTPEELDKVYDSLTKEQREQVAGAVRETVFNAFPLPDELNEIKEPEVAIHNKVVYDTYYDVINGKDAKWPLSKIFHLTEDIILKPEWGRYEEDTIACIKAIINGAKVVYEEEDEQTTKRCMKETWIMPLFFVIKY